MKKRKFRGRELLKKKLGLRKNQPKKRRELIRQKLLKKKFNLKDYPPKKGKKFIIVQIDGLSHTLLKKLIKTPYMPFMRKLLQEYNITKYDPGIPTNTHYIQGLLMYGNDDLIPNYSFYSKEEQKVFAMGKVETAKAIQDQLGDDGILKGGTSVGLFFSGGAERKIITLAHLYDTTSKVKNLRDVIYILTISPLQGLRVFLYLVREIIVEFFENIFDFFKYLFKGKNFNSPFIYPYFPLFRALMNTLTREICTQAVLLELERKSPAIYLNYTGFDTISHYRGPHSISGYSILKEIDTDIKKLYKKAKKQGYDFYVMSDHGQLPAQPFQKKYYDKLEDFIARVAKKAQVGGKTINENQENNSFYLYYKLNHLYKHVSLPLSLPTKLLVKIGKIAMPKPKKNNKIKNKDIVVVTSSSLAKVYFNKKKEKVNLDYIEKNYPGTVKAIANHPGVGFVVVRQGQNLQVISKKGKVIISPKKITIQGENFLSRYGDVERLAKQMRIHMKMKYAGDIVVNGAFDGKTIIAFGSYHYGAHNGIGGEQHDAFFVSKEKYDFSKEINARVLHDLFKQY